MDLFLIITICLAGIAQFILTIVLLVKFFKLSFDIKLIRINTLKEDQDYKVIFYRYIISKEDSKAKDILFEEISKSSEFKQIVKGVNEKFASNLSNKLNERYKKELNMLGFDYVDFSSAAVESTLKHT